MIKKYLNKLFPIGLHLMILQLEEYNYARFLRWISKYLFTREVETKKSLVLTKKAKQLVFLLIISTFTLSFFVFKLANSFILSIIFFFLLLSQPYFGLGIALLAIKPYEMINKRRTIERNRKKILSLKKLKVIAITGSYGKTSTREILYQIMKYKFRVLRTPESYNTIFGITKVIDYELDENYDYFICEMAAYNKGDIKELCYMVPPKYGILTGITEQHLERFKNLENIISTKFELLEAVGNPNNTVFNLDDANIVREIKKRRIKTDFPQVKAENLSFNKVGSSFTISFGKEKYPIRTRLFGYGQVKNILTAASMALKIGLTPRDIAKRICNLKQFLNRFTIKVSDTSIVVDNTYSSNPEGFINTVETAKMVKGKKALVTPGIVELGKDEVRIHYELGLKTRGVFAKTILVGKNQRTLAFAKGTGEPNKIEFIKDASNDYFNKVNELKSSFDWIFLENDITQNY